MDPTVNDSTRDDESYWQDLVTSGISSALKKITSMTIQEDPCLHMIVDDVFPSHFYQEIQKRWPPLSAFNALTSSGRVDGNYCSSRRIWMLTQSKLNNSIDKIPEQDKAFWRQMSQCLTSKEFTSTILKKCATHIYQYRGDEANRKAFYTRPQLVVDKGEYTLGPHTDAPDRAITMLFYMPPDESARECGTSLYLPKNRNIRCHGGPHYDYEDFDLIDTADFLPNRLFMFIKNDASWHGVQPMVCDETKRRVLSVKIIATDQP